MLNIIKHPSDGRDLPYFNASLSLLRGDKDTKFKCSVTVLLDTASEISLIPIEIFTFLNKDNNLIQHSHENYKAEGLGSSNLDMSKSYFANLELEKGENIKQFEVFVWNDNAVLLGWNVLKLTELNIFSCSNSFNWRYCGK